MVLSSTVIKVGSGLWSSILLVFHWNSHGVEPPRRCQMLDVGPEWGEVVGCWMWVRKRAVGCWMWVKNELDVGCETPHVTPPFLCRGFLFQFLLGSFKNNIDRIYEARDIYYDFPFSISLIFLS